MEFIQLKSRPGQGIPPSDGYCFGIKTKTTSWIGAPIYAFRDHPKSNGNAGGWDVRHSTTGFKLILTF